VSLCPPAYYADLLCERGRHYLRKTFAGDGETSGKVFDPKKADWTSGVNKALEESMFYI
jgi:eukaryotic translation initiation factor 2C